EVFGKAVELRIDDGVRPISRDDAAVPTAFADHFVPAQIVERALRRRERLDLEALEEGAWAKLRCRKKSRDLVETGVGIFCRETLIEIEKRREGMVEPAACRRAAKEVIALGEASPDLARIGLDRLAVLACDAELFQRHVLAVEHARDVVVGLDEERRGI